jgi:hypothetical protein
MNNTANGIAAMKTRILMGNRFDFEHFRGSSRVDISCEPDLNKAYDLSCMPDFP